MVQSYFKKIILLVAACYGMGDVVANPEQALQIAGRTFVARGFVPRIDGAYDLIVDSLGAACLQLLCDCYNYNDPEKIRALSNLLEMDLFDGNSLRGVCQESLNGEMRKTFSQLLIDDCTELISECSKRNYSFLAEVVRIFILAPIVASADPAAVVKSFYCKVITPFYLKETIFINNKIDAVEVLGIFITALDAISSAGVDFIDGELVGLPAAASAKTTPQASPQRPSCTLGAFFSHSPGRGRRDPKSPDGVGGGGLFPSPRAFEAVSPGRQPSLVVGCPLTFSPEKMDEQDSRVNACGAGTGFNPFNGFAKRVSPRHACSAKGGSPVVTAAGAGMSHLPVEPVVVESASLLTVAGPAKGGSPFVAAQSVAGACAIVPQQLFGPELPVDDYWKEMSFCADHFGGVQLSDDLERLLGKDGGVDVLKFLKNPSVAAEAPVSMPVDGASMAGERRSGLGTPHLMSAGVPGFCNPVSPVALGARSRGAHLRPLVVSPSSRKESRKTRKMARPCEDYDEYAHGKGIDALLAAEGSDEASESPSRPTKAPRVGPRL